MAALKVGINGFGRIGRLITRALLEMDRPVDLVAINDLSTPEMLAHLFAHDSVHGRHHGSVEVVGGDLVFNGDRLRVTRHADPSDLPWDELEADVVVEASGRFTDRASLESHLAAGAGRVVLSAPGDADVTLVKGINDDQLKDEHRIISNASCTTNCLAPVLKVLDTFGIEEALMTTIHAFTNDQRLLDSPHDDMRRARAAVLSMFPSSTGAARAIGKVMPHLDGKVDGLAVRVPTPNVSLIDVTARITEPPDVETLKEAFERAAASDLNGILRLENEPLVSIDLNHDPHSAIVDGPSLMVHGSLVKVLAWYDNEWGYANRTAELVHRVGALSP